MRGVESAQRRAGASQDRAACVRWEGGERPPGGDRVAVEKGPVGATQVKAVHFGQ